MKINDEGTSNAAYWHERAMKAEARLAEAEAYGKAQQRWAHEWRDKHDALTADNAALRKDAEQCRSDMLNILKAGIIDAPCPTAAQWRQLQDFVAGYLAAMGEKR